MTIPLECSNPLEGVPLVDNVTFTPQRWGRRKIVRVKGANPDVVNGEQNYRIILGAVVIDDPNYSGLEPVDVEIRGLSLTVSMDDQYFVSELDQSSPLFVSYNGHGPITHTAMSDTAIVSIGSGGRYGRPIEWNPPKSAEGIRHVIDVQSTMNGKTFENSVFINVLPSSNLQLSDVAGNDIENLLEVTYEESSLKGVIFGRSDEISASVELREVNIDMLPKNPKERLNTSGFYINEDGPIDIYIPTDFVEDVTDLPGLAYYR